MNDFIFTIEHVFRPYPDSTIETDNSVIFRAQDLNLKQDVCIKKIVIPGGSETEKKNNYQKALSEARTMVRVSKKTNAVPRIHLTHYDPKESVLYIVMDWIPGKSFGTYIDEGPQKVSEFELVTWIEELCSILSIMSEMELYHKDIKPDNIIIDPSRKLHLMDFNISVSLPNKIEGTPFFRAPEMETSKTVSRNKVDVFAIGVILYQYYTNKIPAKGREYGQKSIRNKNPDWDLFVHPRTLNPNMSESMDKIITNCMQKDPAKRCAIKALLRDIRNYKREIKRRGKKDNRGNQNRSSGPRR